MIETRILRFKQPAGTSRGVYNTRKSWFVTFTDPDCPEHVGVGECAPLPDLSIDRESFCPDYESVLREAADITMRTGRVPVEALGAYPSVCFGLETALLHYQRGSTALYDTPFARGEEGITINGLVWMGSYDEMSARLEEKLRQGFRCVKLKIGAIDWEKEIELVRRVRADFPADTVELRVDANGGFAPDEALGRLEELARYDIHSCEQPVAACQTDVLAEICRRSPLPVALDEELIGVASDTDMQRLLDKVMPRYIVIKPSLHGGIYGTERWVAYAAERGIGSWITSALESNVGLNAVAHLAARLYGPDVRMPQGLGTGQLFVDNVPMPLYIKGDKLYYGEDN